MGSDLLKTKIVVTANALEKAFNTSSRRWAAVTYFFSANAQLYSSIAVENWKDKYSY